MPITTRKSISEELTEHIVTGVVTDDEFFDCETDFYRSGPTNLQLWDMSAADLNKITTEGMRQFINRTARMGRERQGGRTAVIVQSKLQYGLGRMAEILGEFASLPFDFRLFQNRPDAIAWLKTETGK
jgi:hypothetical protein